MKKMVLDVGCGSSPKGDVNCDLFVGQTPHLMNNNTVVEPKKTQNFVKCYAEYLPFKDKSFDVVNASQVMEHIISPPNLIREMKRVSREIVIIEVPNLRRFFAEENPHHIYTWSGLSLKNFLELFFSNVTLDVSGYGSYFPVASNRQKYLAIIFTIANTFLEKVLGPQFQRAICKL
jgi:ubiquinone/menaquinone biosynthesis C-methylase UbiE